MTEGGLQVQARKKYKLLDQPSGDMMKVWLYLLLGVLNKEGLGYIYPVVGRSRSSSLWSSAKYTDEEQAKAERRAAILAASERAAQRMRAVNEGKAAEVLMESKEEEEEEEEEEPIRLSSPPAATTPPPPKAYQDDDLELVVPRSDFDVAKERFKRAPEGYRPFYNTGDGYLSDLAQDSVKRHWSVHGETKGLDSIERKLGARPDDEDVMIQTEPIPEPLPQDTVEKEEKVSFPPAADTAAAQQQPAEVAAAVPAPTVNEEIPTPLAAGISCEEESTISKAIQGLVQYVQVVQASGSVPQDDIGKRLLTQLEQVRDVIIADAARQPQPAPTSQKILKKDKTEIMPPPELPMVTAPPTVVTPRAAAPVKATMNIAGLDASAIAATVADIGPAFAVYSPKFQEFALDGDFLAALSPNELDDTLCDLGMSLKLERRRVAFALGLLVHD